MANDFYQNVFDLVKVIPKGRVTSYGAIAKYLGATKSSRLVGWAMNISHTQEEYIPAHRVVNRNGMLTGKMHFSSPTEMETRLETEGILVIDDQIQNFKSIFWNPEKELG